MASCACCAAFPSKRTVASSAPRARATPMAGLMGMSPARFLLLDGAGVTLWASLYLGLGVIFRTELERIARIVARTGTSLAAVLIVTVGGYLGWKWLDRQRYLRRLAMAR